MSKLMSIQTMAQQVAVTITSVLNIETMIVDEKLQYIAGTGQYMDYIGTYEAEAFGKEEYLYRYLLREGGTYVVDDTDNPMYGPVKRGETGEVCCAIDYNGDIIGLIALVSFNQVQYDALLGNYKSVCAYLLNMAALISSYLSAQESYAKINLQTELLNTIVDSSPDGILVLSSAGVITQCNTNAENIIGIKRKQLINSEIDGIWPDSTKKFLKEINGFSNRECSFTNGRIHSHLLLSSRPICINNQVENVILFFKDIVEAKQIAYQLKGNSAHGFDSIQGNSAQIENLKELARTVAASNSTVLITGESGTGKEMFAKAIHNVSPRSSAPFITINCGAIPEALMESELFGYIEGAFTGALKGGHKGKFESANGGTIFIDEVGDLQMHLQAKLLHVLQRRKLERVGSNELMDIDVRIISATNRNLAEMCKNGTFREDLYYRLNVIPLHLPPLRERPEDVIALAAFFLKKYNMLLGREIVEFSQEALMALLSHNWPGNIRELENVIEYSINVTKSDFITFDDLPPLFKTNAGLNVLTGENADLKTRMLNYEDHMMLKYLEQFKAGAITRGELASQLGISRTSLYRKLKRIERM